MSGAVILWQSIIIGTILLASVCFGFYGILISALAWILWTSATIFMPWLAGVQMISVIIGCILGLPFALLHLFIKWLKYYKTMLMQHWRSELFAYCLSLFFSEGLLSYYANIQHYHLNLLHKYITPWIKNRGLYKWIEYLLLYCLSHFVGIMYSIFISWLFMRIKYTWEESRFIVVFYVASHWQVIMTLFYHFIIALITFSWKSLPHTPIGQDYLYVFILIPISLLVGKKLDEALYVDQDFLFIDRVFYCKLLRPKTYQAF